LADIVLKREQAIFIVSGISCMDCAEKFEREVASLPGIVKATLNTITGKLAVEGEVDVEAIRRMAYQHDYTVEPVSYPKSQVNTVFNVKGITCMDCAQKFEKAVNRLPGVVNATLNPVTGKLTVEGEVGLEAIQKLGENEEYTITLEVPVVQTDGQKKEIDWELRRAVGSGISLAAAYLIDTLGGSITVFLPLYIVAMFLGGWDNFKKAARSLRHLTFNMSVLMSVAVVGAFAIGQYEEGATVAFLFAISEMLEAWTVERARRSIKELVDIAPLVATVKRDDGEYEIAAEEVRIGDLIIIRPGEKIAMDGIILQGDSAINQAAITGESIPVEKGPGAEVFAGTLNMYGSLTIQVTKHVKDTTIAKIIHMVEEAQTKRAPAQALVEKFAAVYTPVVMAMAVGIIVIPPVFLGHEWIPWIYRGLSLMVVACPCALVISTPVAIVSAISTAARNGVLIKGGVYLEETAALKAIAFDKTGTLTEGKPSVTDLVPVGVKSADRLLAMAARLETRSEHPLAQAIVKAAEERQLAVMPVEDFTAIAGLGAQGTIDGEMVYVGNLRLFLKMGSLIERYAQEIDRLQGEGKTVIIIGTKNMIFGLIAVADEVRAASASTLSALKLAGIQQTFMLTGDNTQAAQAIAAQVGIDHYLAELLPQDKVASIDELLRKHGKVAMVGDGINDAPAMAMASVGIAMGGAGTDTALETADIVLMADDLTKLPFAIRLSRNAMNIIRQNIGFSLAIKAIAVLAVFPGWLTLWLAILADMGATILVTLNSIRLLQERP
jgi:Cd2+/Zn2+-exporting ATPase